MGDLSDAGWAFLEPFVIRTTLRGNPDKYGKRLILNALLYWVKTGCQFRVSLDGCSRKTSAYRGLWSMIAIAAGTNRAFGSAFCAL
jgi:transposase